MITETEQHLQKLMTFMHRSPLAMAETDAGGGLRHLNPKAVQLMMPMAAYLGLSGDNLLDTLDGFLPTVKATVAGFEGDSGMIFDQEPYHFEFNMESGWVERFFSLTIEKMKPDSLLIFFDDVTDFLIKADQLRQPI
jgi:hypothetical protein